MAVATASDLPAQQGQQGSPGSLRGIVVREDTSEPIRDVRITIGRGAASAQAIRVAAEEAAQTAEARGNSGTVARLLEQVLASTFGNAAADAADGPQFDAITDINGRFSIERIPPGEYPVTAQRDGYFGTGGDTSAAVTGSATITVTSQQTTEFTLKMIPAAAVSGKVLDPSGNPAVSVPIELLRRVYVNGAATLQFVMQRPSDDRGEYRHFQLPPGEYFLAAAPAGSRTYYPDATDVRNARPVTLRPGADVTKIDLRMRTVPGAKISGRVVSQLQSAQGGNALLTLLPRDTNLLFDPRITVGLEARIVSPADGTFEILNVPPGSYDLYATLPDPRGWGPTQPPGRARQPRAYGRTSIDVIAGDVNGVVVSVRTGLDVKGQVFFDGTPASNTSDLSVSLQPADSSAGVAVYNQVGKFQPTIEPDGSFVIPAVPEAKYRLQPTVSFALTAADLPRNAYVADVRQGGSSIYDDGLHIGTTLPGSIEVLIRTDGSEIQGTVARADQQPLPAETTVVLVAPLNRRQNPALYKTEFSDAQGKFSIRGVPPGQYKLFAFERIPAGAHLNTDFMKAYEDRGVSIAVSAGAVLSQAVTLIPAEK
jgi:hypothetical protein